MVRASSDRRALVAIAHGFWKVRLDKFERGLRKQVGNGKALLSGEWGFGFKGVGKSCYAILRNGEIMEVNRVWDDWFCNNRQPNFVSSMPNTTLLGVEDPDRNRDSNTVDLSHFSPILIDSTPQHIITTLGKKINWYLSWELICDSYAKTVDPNDHRRFKLRASDSVVYGVPDGFFRSWCICLVRSQVLMPFQKEYTVLSNGKTACDYWYELSPYYAALLQDIANEWPDRVNSKGVVEREMSILEARRNRSNEWRRKHKFKETKV
jgi:hypothetical protein